MEAPERFREMGERGYERARALFSAEKIVDQYLAYYREMLAI